MLFIFYKHLNIIKVKLFRFAEILRSWEGILFMKVTCNQHWSSKSTNLLDHLLLGYEHDHSLLLKLS